MIALDLCLFLAYLLDSVLIALLQCEDLTSSLFSVVDLFPRLHLFLLEEGDTICEELCISLNANYSKTTIRICNGYEIRLLTPYVASWSQQEKDSIVEAFVLGDLTLLRSFTGLGLASALAIQQQLYSNRLLLPFSNRFLNQ